MEAIYFLYAKCYYLKEPSEGNIPSTDKIGRRCVE